MVNFYDFISNNSYFKKFTVEELLFTEYDCPIKKKEIELWSHNNSFFYVIGGKKMWITQENSYMVKAGESVFVKKGANMVHQYFDSEFCVLVIFVSDDFIRGVIEKYQPKIILEDLDIESDSVIRNYH